MLVNYRHPEGISASGPAEGDTLDVMHNPLSAAFAATGVLTACALWFAGAVATEARDPSPLFLHRASFPKNSNINVTIGATFSNYTCDYYLRIYIDYT